MQTLDYLDAVKTKLGLESDYALAKYMSWSTSQMSHYRLKRRALDDFQAARVAEVLERDPLELIAVANAERAKDEGEKDYWLALAETRAAQKKTARRSGPSSLAPRPGLEPGTYGLTVRRSTD